MTYTLDTCKVQPSLCVSLGQFAKSVLPCTGAFGRMESNTAALMKILDSLESQERMVKAMLEDRKKQLNGKSKSKPQPGMNQLAESTAQVLDHDHSLFQLTTADICRERCKGKCHHLVTQCWSQRQSMAACNLKGAVKSARVHHLLQSRWEISQGAHRSHSNMLLLPFLAQPLLPF